MEKILNDTFKQIEDITDVHEMTNVQLKRLIKKIEVDKDGNVDIYLRLLGDLGFFPSDLLLSNCWIPFSIHFPDDPVLGEYPLTYHSILLWKSNHRYTYPYISVAFSVIWQSANSIPSRTLHFHLLLCTLFGILSQHSQLLYFFAEEPDENIPVKSESILLHLQLFYLDNYLLLSHFFQSKPNAHTYFCKYELFFGF